MENIIAVEAGEIVAFPAVQMTKTRLIIPETTSFEEWQDIGRNLRSAEGAIQFWIGDWINFGERKWGERYLEAVRETGYDYKTLRNLAWVAKRFELSRRRDNLSWSHHQEVTALPPEIANRLLDDSEKDGDSRAQLRGRVWLYKEKHNLLPAPDKKEYAFSWFHEPHVEAMLDGMKAIRAGVDLLIHDPRDSDVADKILSDTLVLMRDISKDIEYALDDGSV